MKKFYKFLGIAAAILVLLVAILIVLAKILITPERIRETVLPLAQNQLQREVRLGDVKVSLFSGISLNDLEILEREGSQSFISANRVVLRYKLWPLFFKRVVIEEVRLDAPMIRVERFTTSSFNFSDLLHRERKDVDESQKPLPAEGSATAASSIDLLVSEVSVVNGELLFVDHTLVSRKPQHYKMTNLKLNAKSISLLSAFPFSVETYLNESQLLIKGELDLKTLYGKAKVTLSNLDVTAFKPYFHKQLPGRLGSLKVNLELSAEGNGKSVVSSGMIAMQQIDLALDKPKDVSVQNGSLLIDYALSADLKRSSLHIEESKLTFNGIPVEISGTVENFTTKPLVDIIVALSNFNLRKTVDSLPEKLRGSLVDLDPAGVVNARIHLAGSVAEPKKLIDDGEVRVEGIQVTTGGQRPTLTGVFILKGTFLTSENLKLQIGENQAVVNFRADNFAKRPIVISSNISANRFNLDPLLKNTDVSKGTVAKQQEKGETEPGRSLPSEKPPRTEPGPLDLPLKADGEVRIGQTLYRGLMIEDLHISYRLENNILRVETFTGKVAGGSFDKRALVDLGKKGFDYSAELSLSRIQAGPLIKTFLPKASGNFSGTLSLNTTMSSRGTLSETVKKYLSAKGDFFLKDWELTPDTTFVRNLSEFLNRKDLGALSFSQADGSFTIRDGKVSISSDFSGSDVRMSPQGNIGLDGTLDITLNSRLSPQLTKKLGKKAEFTQYLTDEQGWTRLPLRLVGTTASPRLVPDAEVVQRQIGEAIGKELQKKFQKRVFDKKSSSKSDQNGKEDQNNRQKPVEELLEETLKGLFGN